MGDHHGFDVGYAKRFGVNEAIMIQSVTHWIKKNAANGQNEQEGRWWTYNSVRAWSKLFPYWTPKVTGTILRSLIEKGVLITGRFNKAAYDRTLWYAFCDESEFLGDMAHQKEVPTILPNGKMETPESSNGLALSVKPIPLSDPISSPVSKSSSSDQRLITDLFQEKFMEKSGGSKPTWLNQDFASIKRILKQHSVSEVLEVIRAYFDEDHWFTKKDGYRFASMMRFYDEIKSSRKVTGREATDADWDRQLKEHLAARGNG